MRYVRNRTDSRILAFICWHWNNLQAGIRVHPPSLESAPLCCAWHHLVRGTFLLPSRYPPLLPPGPRDCIPLLLPCPRCCPEEASPLLPCPTNSPPLLPLLQERGSCCRVHLKGEPAHASMAEGTVKLACPHCQCFWRKASLKESRQRTSPRACTGREQDACSRSWSQLCQAGCRAPSMKRHWLVRTAVWKIMQRLRAELSQMKLWARCCFLHWPWTAM